MASKVLLAAVVLMAASHVALAHGGGLHGWDFQENPSNYTYKLVATCRNPQPYRVVNTTFLPGPLPYWEPENATAGINITGIVEVYMYVDATCRTTAAFIPYLLLNTTDGAPYAHKKVYGYGFTGSCSRGVGDLYRGNLTLGNTRLNLMWWREGETTEDGALWGSAPNTFDLRRPGQEQPLSSVLLVPPPQDSMPFCCDIDWDEPYAAWLANAQAACRPSSNPAAHGRKMMRRM